MLANTIRVIADVIYKNEWNKIKEKTESLKRIIENTYIPHSLVIFLVAGEDKRFFYHYGFDIIGIIRAIKMLLFSSKIEGASTIEQQLVRVISGRYEISLIRKVREIFLATLISHNFSKEHIAKSYIYIAYYGWKMNGLKQALKRLDIDLMSASDDDLANLIARIRYPHPSILSKNRKNLINRRKNYILNIAYNELKRKK